MLKPGCYECKFRGGVPGSAHSKCNHPANEPVLENSMAGLFSALSGGHAPPISVEGGIKVKGHPHGIANGWFGWPFNFDPVWLEECNGFEAAEHQMHPTGGEAGENDVESTPPTSG